jgi:hypothetical protein
LVRKAVSEYLKTNQNRKTERLNWVETSQKLAVPMGGISQRIDEELYQ